MTRVLRHRGPDDAGTHIADGLGFAFARLSIVDLEGGHQPMGNEDGSIWIVFNGEIYNHPELREDLLAKGHTFRTRSDTEVILHLYEELGADCVKRFNGQFAFAIWDGPRRRLFLARDRVGVRPLFYAEHQGRFLFGSEIKALLQAPDFPREIDARALDQILTFWFPIPPRTGFAGVHELPPGHTMTVDDEGTTVARYWNLEFPRRDDFPEASPRAEEEITRRLMELLDDAVRIRLRADVPVGAYLSGGLDSSVVAALCRRRVDALLKTYSIGFEDREYDESAFQSAMVRHLNTEHHAFHCRSPEIGHYFPAAVWHAERAVIRTAPVPMMLLAKGVRGDGIKVVLTGEGADEVLAGYDIFKEAKVRRFWARNPRSRMRPLLLRRLYPYLARMQQASGYVHSYFGQGIEETDDPFYSHRPRWHLGGSLRGLYSPSTREALRGYDPIAELEAELPPEFRHWDPLCQAQYLEMRYLLPGYILSSQGDRMSMAFSVEGRFPFLDHRVIEFAARITPRLKLKGLREKNILKRGARGLVPDPILERDKQPYRAPDHAALMPQGNLPGYAREALSESAVSEAGVLAAKPLQTLLHKCARQDSLGIRDSMALVGSLSVQLIHEHFVKRGSGGPACWNDQTR